MLFGCPFEAQEWAIHQPIQTVRQLFPALISTRWPDLSSVSWFLPSHQIRRDSLRQRQVTNGKGQLSDGLGNICKTLHSWKSIALLFSPHSPFSVYRDAALQTSGYLLLSFCDLQPVWPPTLDFNKAFSSAYFIYEFIRQKPRDGCDPSRSADYETPDQQTIWHQQPRSANSKSVKSTFFPLFRSLFWPLDR